jgi:predicted Zn-dependent peptidase
VLSRWQDAGISIIAADLPGRSVASIGLLIADGIKDEPLEFAGLTQLTARVLSDGTANYDVEEYSQAIERLGVNVGVSAGWSTINFNLTGPVERLAAGSELLAESLFTPRLEAETILHRRHERVEQQRTQSSRQGTRANSAIRRVLYAPTERHSRSESGDEVTNAGLEPEQVYALHAQWLTRPRALVVAGDLARVNLDAIVARLSVGVGAELWQAPESQQLPVRAERRRTLLIDRPGAAQSTVLIAHRGPLNSDPDFAALNAVGNVLGGSFNSRLNHQLRQVKGYTYGASGSFNMGGDSGALRASAEVRTDATAPAVADAVNEILRLQRDGVTDAEGHDALMYLIGSFATSLETPYAIGNAARMIVTQGLPDDHHTRLREQYAALTTGDLNTAATRHIDAERLAVVIEGDLATFSAELDEALLGEATVVTADQLNGYDEL